MMATNFIEENDNIILYFSRTTLQRIKVKSDTFTNTKYGKLYHNSIIGQEYNSKYYFNNNFVYIFKSDIHFDTLTKKKYTQILYEEDIAAIINGLNIKHDNIVMECGTGSGILTEILSQFLTNGKVITIENNKERFENLKKENIGDNTEDSLNKKVKIENTINNYHYKNIIFYNCNITDIKIENILSSTDKVDSLFLDMADPHNIKDLNFIKSYGRIVVFLPSIEQVKKMIERINDDFYDIKLIENTKREYIAFTNKLNGERGYVVDDEHFSFRGYLIIGKKK
ncbi:tRNA methyltransferase complex GCD14 subunit [Spraguea lophii 42_110]|uniref:tRNA (adenine(58)-N(1))-methyltransferase catalytic subunit TRM61 n=1 Tax=Spraguea lophii (strain 42_110) TaxID=1358809 RepID=S7WCY7_SPRLO|nr:tRNA methyltransferase complex GCD14 subunit [Spraguea lophii 42_110]